MLWKSFFILIGFGSLLYQNSILNIVPYLIINVHPNIYTYHQFADIFGGLLAFLISPILFKEFSNKSTIRNSFILSGIFYFLVIYLV